MTDFWGETKPGKIRKMVVKYNQGHMGTGQFETCWEQKQGTWEELNIRHHHLKVLSPELQMVVLPDVVCLFSGYQKQCTSLDCNQTGHPDSGFDWPSSIFCVVVMCFSQCCGYTVTDHSPTCVSCFPSSLFLLVKSCPIQLFSAPIPYFYLFSASKNIVKAQ